MNRTFYFIIYSQQIMFIFWLIISQDSFTKVLEVVEGQLRYSKSVEALIEKEEVGVLLLWAFFQIYQYKFDTGIVIFF